MVVELTPSAGTCSIRYRTGDGSSPHKHVGARSLSGIDVVFQRNGTSQDPAAPWCGNHIELTAQRRRLSPSAVQNHRKPCESWTIRLTRLCAKPVSVLYVLIASCSDPASRANPIAIERARTRTVPIVEWRDGE